MDKLTRILMLGLALGMVIFALSQRETAPVEESERASAEAADIHEPVSGETKQFGPFKNPRMDADFDAMVARRMVRVLVVRSKTDYFFDGATQRGLTYDLLKEFEKFLNNRLKTRALKLHVVFIPVPRGELINALLKGRGDIAVANLTITPERSTLVDFSTPMMRNVEELLVTGNSGAAHRNMLDLSGLEVHVRFSSSYYQSLLEANAGLVEQGLAPIKLTRVDENLEDEDLLEMVNAGLMNAIVVDAHKARFWEQIFDQVTVHSNIVLRSGGDIGWAFRKDSPQLKSQVDDFLEKHRKGSLVGNILLRKYLQNTSFVENAVSSEEMGKFNATVGLFQKYGGQYEFDWLMLMAQAYQESRLDHSARSSVGAIGIMQMLPSTAADKNVGIPDISDLENNIHAGTKYLRFIRDRYFSREDMDETNQTLFSFAAYNAGPARIARLRREARSGGLDPDIWFDNVELVAAREIGRETVQYVSNIYKYYVAYTLTIQNQVKKEQALKLI